MAYYYQRKESNIAALIIFVCWLAAVYLLCPEFLDPVFMIYGAAPFWYLLDVITLDDDDLNETYDILDFESHLNSLRDRKILVYFLILFIMSVAMCVQFWLVSKLGVYSDERYIEFIIIAFLCCLLSRVIAAAVATMSTIVYIN